MNHTLAAMHEGVDLELTTSTFPSGESYIKIKDRLLSSKLNPPSPTTIYYLFNGDKSFMQLMLLTDSLRRMGVKDIQLIIPYFPGARCDRVNEKNAGEPLNVAVYAHFINAQKYSKVVVLDPHSDVTPALINNVEVVSNRFFMTQVWADLLSNPDVAFKDEFVLVSPDAGASKKIEAIQQLMNIPMVQAAKQRDMATGKLVPGACKIFAEPDQIKGKRCIIVDDICSKGGTFIAIANELKAMEAKEVYLAVTHFEGHEIRESLERAGIVRLYSATQLVGMDHVFYNNLNNSIITKLIDDHA